jgi:hypothetical protein
MIPILPLSMISTVLSMTSPVGALVSILIAGWATVTAMRFFNAVSCFKANL